MGVILFLSLCVRVCVYTHACVMYVGVCVWKCRCLYHSACVVVRAQTRSQPFLSILFESGSFPCFVAGPYARLSGDT